MEMPVASEDMPVCRDGTPWPVSHRRPGGEAPRPHAPRERHHDGQRAHAGDPAAGIEPVRHFGSPGNPSTEGATSYQPRATPLGTGEIRSKALKGRLTAGTPLQGFVQNVRWSQGVARVERGSGLGWYDAGPLALRADTAKCRTGSRRGARGVGRGDWRWGDCRLGIADCRLVIGESAREAAPSAICNPRFSICNPPHPSRPPRQPHPASAATPQGITGRGCLRLGARPSAPRSLRAAVWSSH